MQNENVGSVLVFVFFLSRKKVPLKVLKYLESFLLFPTISLSLGLHMHALKTVMVILFAI